MPPLLPTLLVLLMDRVRRQVWIVPAQGHLGFLRQALIGLPRK
jgi:hypothetical protein